jgi:hypothetical protein
MLSEVLALLNSIQAESGDDGVINLCETARDLSDWVGALKELTGAIEARLTRWPTFFSAPRIRV